MKYLAALVTILAVLPGCAVLDRPADFALEDYPGDTPFERVLARANLETNRAPSCSAGSLCQPRLPSREELGAANRYDCKAYVMAKAYALQDAGIDESRMRVAKFDIMGAAHVVLVVDERYVLDNLDSSVRRLEEYTKFKPALAGLPPTFMVRNPERAPLLSELR